MRNGSHSAALIAAVEELFGREPAPGSLSEDAYESELADIERLLLGKSWWSVPQADLESLSGSILLPLLTVDAFLYYLPAYLSAVARGGFDETATDFLLYNLDSREQDGTLRANLTPGRHRIARKCVGALARHCREFEQKTDWETATRYRLRNLISRSFARTVVPDDVKGADQAPPEIDPSHLPRDFRTERMRRARRWDAVWPYIDVDFEKAPWTSDLDLRVRAYYLPFAMDWMLSHLPTDLGDEPLRTIEAVRLAFYTEEVKSAISREQRHVAEITFRLVAAMGSLA